MTKKKSIIMLIIFLSLSFFVFFNIKETKAIYRNTFHTSVSLSIIDSSSTFEVSFNTHGGTPAVATRYKAYNEAIGSLPDVYKEGYNFLGWYTAETGGIKVNAETLVTGAMPLHAQYAKIVCKKAITGTLHTETCNQSNTAGCRSSGYAQNATITYGTIPGANSPISGDAYDCDVNNDGTYDPVHERFYFIREIENEETVALVHYTSFDAAGQMDSSTSRLIYEYTPGKQHLPSSTTWPNPALTSIDGKVSRYINADDLEAACGSFTLDTKNYLDSCQYFMETSRFQSNSLGRSGIWIEQISGSNHRIDTRESKVASVASDSENAVRPVIEIPINTLEGFQKRVEYTITFVTNGGDAISPITRYAGDNLGNIANAVRTGFHFVGWYSDPQLNVSVTAQTIVNGNMTLYAAWDEILTARVTFNNNGGTGGVPYIDVDIGECIDPLPAPTLEDNILVGWYQDEELTIPFTTETIVNDDMDVYARWISDEYVAIVNGTGYTTLAAAINAVPTTGVKTTVKIIKDIEIDSSITVSNTRNVEFDANGFTISNSSTYKNFLFVNNGIISIKNGTFTTSSDASEKGVISNWIGSTLNISGGRIYTTTTNTIQNRGTINITGGEIECSGMVGAINNNADSILNISGGSVKNTSTTGKQAIYNDGGTLSISGNAYIENSSNNGAKTRAAVQNNAGTVTITGGTIVSKNYIAVVNNDIMTIGTLDNTIDITTPVLQGKTYALDISANKTVNVYDGIFKSLDNNTPINTLAQAEHESDTTFIDDTESIDGNSYYVTYLNIIEAYYTVTFNPDNGESTIVVSNVPSRSTVGTRMPSNPSKANYIFEKWYISGDVDSTFTSSSVVKSDLTVIASWRPNILLATVSPSSVSVAQGNTQALTVTGPSGMENYTFTSSNENIATVSANGTVTGVAVGSATITITGEESHETKMVNVSVTPPIYNVTFDKDDGTTPTVIQVESGDTIDTQMPSNPSRTNYIFVGWYKNGNTDYPVSSTTQVSGNMTVVAVWKETIEIATVSPNELTVGENKTETISVTGSTYPLENYTFSSSDTSVATVDASGVVRGISVGTATITVRGATSNTTKTVSVTVYAITYHTVTYMSDGDVYDTDSVADGETIDNLPTAPTKTGYIFVGWYTDANYTTEIDGTEIITADETYVARWTDSNVDAVMNNTLYSTVQAAVDAAGNTKTTIKLLRDVTYTTLIDLYSKNQSKNIVFDLNGFTITNNSNYVIRSKATIEVKNGTVRSAAGYGAIETNDGGKLIMNNGRVEATGTRAALYNDGGTMEIGGDVYISANALIEKNKDRGTVQNVKGTMTITGGTIVSTRGYGLSITGGTVTIGQVDGVHDTSSIIIQSASTGIYASVNYSFYDGIVKGVTSAVNDDSHITNHENGATPINNHDGTYYTLYYGMPSQFTINFNANGGNVNPNLLTFNVGTSVNSGSMPTPTKGIYDFDGWYRDEQLTTAVTYPIDISAAGSTTYYAKWSYTASDQVINFNMTNDVMTDYYANISTWKNYSSSQFQTSMDGIFNTYSCAECTGPNYQSCPTPPQGATLCDQPKGYATGVTEGVNVYLSDEVNKQKGNLVTYTTSTDGVIYNMIPGQVYYWESAVDSNVHGLVKALGNRRTISSPVRNVRDLGGMEVSYTVNNVTTTGKIKYGRLLRGAALSSSQSDANSLTKLGMTREIDLRKDSEGSGQARLAHHDNDNSNDIIVTNYLINPDTYPDNYSALRSAITTMMNYVIAGDNLYFHCTIGTDRTGTVAYFLEGLLGVSEEDRLEDYELSYFYGLLNRHRFHDYLDGSSINPRFATMHSTYDTNNKIYQWYMSGSSDVTADETLINNFRDAMIDKNV